MGSAHLKQQATHFVSHGATSALQAEADKRGHGNRTAGAVALGAIGIGFGTFFGLIPALVVGGLLTAAGYAIGDEMDKK